MRREPEAEAARWLAQAERDLDDAEYNLRGQRFNVACFLAQQSAEKALKAYLYHQGAEEVIGHSVMQLCRECEEFNAEFAHLRRSAAPLDQYYTPTRYPNALPGGIPADAYNEDDAKRAIRLAREILAFVKGALGANQEMVL